MAARTPGYGGKMMRMRHLLLSFLPAPGTPAELDPFVKQQRAAWGKKIKDAGFQPE
jgi:tripartite-type tricarboxylate transporter receptor subunit TctC